RVCALLPGLSSWRCPRREQVTEAHGMHRQANRPGIARKDAHSMGVHLIDSALFGDQFSTAAMRRVFDDAAMVRSWMQVEASLARAEAAVGLIPRSAADMIRTCVAETTWDPAALAEGIAATFHPLVPAIRLLAERCGEAGAYVHWGATTQDIMDTGL